jgi:hypothetical protein
VFLPSFLFSSNLADLREKKNGESRKEVVQPGMEAIF